MSTGTFDVLVVGGGIVGARIAFEASRSGLKVALVDAGDFGGATSSASGKLVHGGLSYLRTGKVRLVREAHRERRVLVELERSRGTLSGAVLKRLDGEGLLTVRCRTVVNATGPWLDHLRLMEDPKRKPAVRLSKGVHLVLPPEADWRAAFTLSLDDGRHVYAVPWRGMLLLGTTDTAYEGDPGAVTPVPAEVAYLLATASRFLPEEMLRPDRVSCSFAGLRVLPRSDEGTYEATREHVVRVGLAGMISVGGGKLTTHRLIALDALRRLPPELRPRTLRPNLDPLPGSSPPDVRVLHVRLDASTARHLMELYGGEAEKLLRYATRFPDAFEKVHPQGPDIWAQVYHAADEEWAVTIEDVVRRRTTPGIRGLASDDVRARISSALAIPSQADHDGTPSWFQPVTDRTTFRHNLRFF